MESIDDLLAQVKAEYEEKDKPLEVKKPPSLPKEQLKQPPAIAKTTQVQTGSKKPARSPEDALLLDLKAEFEAQQQEAELEKQQQLKEEQKRQEQIQQRKRQALTQKAEAWLKKLNPRSEEGLWFEEFAYAYPSKLEAAIDYLLALEETKS